MNDLLVTGFEPFGGAGENTSAWIIDALQRDPKFGAETALLPVEYDVAPRRLLEECDRQNPRRVLLLGMAGPGRRVRVETLARNADRASLADNAGVLRNAASHPIVDGGRQTIAATWRPEWWAERLMGCGIPAVLSGDAGGFLCNHTYYRALNDLGAGVQVIFLHVPAPANEKGGWNAHEARVFASALVAIVGAAGR